MKMKMGYSFMVGEMLVLMVPVAGEWKYGGERVNEVEDKVWKHIVYAEYDKINDPL